MTAFQTLGALLGLYTLYAAICGKVYAKSGPWGRVVAREESPTYFWVVIAIYAGLALVLAVLF